MNKLLLIINSVACGLIALRLIFYQRNGAQYKPFISCIAYLMVICTGTVPIRACFQDYQIHDFSEVLINLVLCFWILSVRGNIAQLFWKFRHE